jgi:hypothetical protein
MGDAVRDLLEHVVALRGEVAELRRKAPEPTSPRNGSPKTASPKTLKVTKKRTMRDTFILATRRSRWRTSRRARKAGIPARR